MADLIQPAYACESGNIFVITFPDGRSLSYPPPGTQLPGLGLFPEATAADEQTFINLDFLMRPPLSDEEITLMPNNDAIALYYKLAPITGYSNTANGGYGTNPDISAGLYDLAVTYELTLRQRIWDLRPDLASISDGTKVYRVLLPANMLVPPNPPPSNALGGGLLSVLGVVLSFIPVVGWIAEVGLTAYELTDTIETMQAAGRAAQLGQNILDEVTSGINLVHQLVPDPAPNAGAINALQLNYNSWQNSVQSAPGLIPTIEQLAPNMCGGSYFLLVEAGGVDAFFNAWKPWQNYFYSQGVADMVLGSGAITSTVAAAGPVVAGLGLGLLAFLLL